MQRTSIFLAALLGLAAAGAAHAQQPQSIEIAVNKAELLRFQKAPGSVLVVNPGIADIVADGSARVFVLGKAPGETQLFVLDDAGRTMLQANVRVVTAPSGQVSVFRGVAESTLNCAPRCTGASAAGGIPSGGSTVPAAAASAPAPAATPSEAPAPPNVPAPNPGAPAPAAAAAVPMAR
jgi:hypothetical protein